MKRALIGKVDGKLRIAVHARIWHVYVCTYVYNLESRERMEDTDSTKKGNGRLGKLAIDTLD